MVHVLIVMQQLRLVGHILESWRLPDVLRSLYSLLALTVGEVRLLSMGLRPRGLLHPSVAGGVGGGGLVVVPGL